MKKTYNLIILVPDQMRADYLGCYGKKEIRTPNIDALANEGVRFENAYCAAPLCGPSRCSFATSTYVSEHNHWNYWSTISPDVPNIVTSVKKQGYKTGMFGKNHLFTYSRLDEVWDDLNEICLGNYDGHPKYTHSFSSFTLEKDHPYNITEQLTTEGIDFIERNQESPFLLWINYQDPHPAYCCPAPYDSMYDPETISLTESQTAFDRNQQPVRNETFRIHSEMDQCTEDDLKRAVAHYMGQITYVDDNIGRIVKRVNELGIRDRTIILFFSDHGEFLGDYGMVHKNPTFYDCLSRIPVILSYVGKSWQGVSYPGLVEQVDLAPTLLELLNIPIPPTMVGKSLVEGLEKGDYSGKESILCEAGGGGPTCKEPIVGYRQTAPHEPTSLGPGAMIRYKHFKLSIYADDSGELYDLNKDPFELKNLYNKEGYEKLQAEMTTRLVKRILSVKVRDTNGWDYPEYPHDVRFEPLEYCGEVLKDIRKSK